MGDAYIKFDKKDVIKYENHNNKILLILSYLKINSPLNGHVGISIDALCRSIGYSPNHRKNKINQNIIDGLEYLKANGIITYNDILQGDKSIKRNDCFFIELDVNNKIFNTDESFVILYESEFKKIVESKTNSNKQDLLNVYLNIKKFINFDDQSNRICYPSHKSLCKDCNILSTGSINKIIKDLELIGILYTYNAGKYIDDNGNVKYVNNLYSVNKNRLIPYKCDEFLINHYKSKGIIINNFIKEKENSK